MARKMGRHRRKVRRWSGMRTTYHEVEITWSYRGYSDPGVSSGPPEQCYPPEGDDERELVGLKIGDVEIPQALVVQLVPHLQPIIDEEEIPDED